MHIGQNQQSGGRAGEAAAMGLSASLLEIGLELGRLKTGTPPRLLRRSIDFSKTQIQPGDEPVPYFSYWRDDLFHVEQSGDHPPKEFHVEHSVGSRPDTRTRSGARTFLSAATFESAPAKDATKIPEHLTVAADRKVRAP